MAALLNSRRVGALVVLDAERVVGIVSERDVVRAVADAGAVEAIYLAEGQLHEGSSSAILVVKGREVGAPVESSAILPSTSRALVLKLATAAGLTPRIGEVSEARLRSADEIWMCSATRPIVPVVSLDGTAVGSGTPGPYWREVRKLFYQYRRDIASLPPLAGRN